MRTLQGKWIESDKGKHAFYIEGVNEKRRASAVIFHESGIGYTYSLNFSRCVGTGTIKAKTLEEAKKEVESILYAELNAPSNGITLYYHLEYYILIFDKNEIKVDDNHIQACPPERFREGRIQELKKRSGVIEIWQCHGGILIEMIKTVLYREDDNITTIYDAVKYSGRLLL